MRQILPHSLWLGHAKDAEDFKQIFDLGINALVQLAVEEPAVQLPRELIYCRFPLVDGPGNEARLLSLAITTHKRPRERPWTCRPHRPVHSSSFGGSPMVSITSFVVSLVLPI